MATVPERLATLEAKVDTLTLDARQIKEDVRTLLKRDIERATMQRLQSRVVKAVPWAALATGVIAILRGGA